MNPASLLSSANERLRISKSLLKNRDTFPDSLARFGDIQSHRNLCARIIRRIRREQSNVRAAIRLCAFEAIGFIRNFS